MKKQHMCFILKQDFIRRENWAVLSHRSCSTMVREGWWWLWPKPVLTRCFHKTASHHQLKKKKNKIKAISCPIVSLGCKLTGWKNKSWLLWGLFFKTHLAQSTFTSTAPQQPRKLRIATLEGVSWKRKGQAYKTTNLKAQQGYVRPWILVIITPNPSPSSWTTAQGCTCIL